MSSNHCYDNLIVDQGSAGVCWLASIIHAMFYSDGTRPMFRAKMQEIIDRLENHAEVDIVDTTLLNAYNLFNTNRKINANTHQQKSICINLPTVASSIVDITFDKCTPQVRKIMDTKVERNFFSTRTNSKSVLETGASSHLQLPRLLKWAGIYEKAKIYRFHNLCDSRVMDKILNDGKDCDMIILTFSNNQISPPPSITVNDTKYVLDACLLSSLREKHLGSPLLQASESSKRVMFEQMQKTNGHAIAGVTCGGRRFVYNSWWSKVPTKTDWYSSAMLLSNDKSKMNIMSAQYIDTLCDIVTHRYRTNKSYFYHLAGGTNTMVYVKNSSQNDLFIQRPQSLVDEVSTETIIQPQNAHCQCDAVDIDNDITGLGGLNAQTNDNQPRSLSYNDVDVQFIVNTLVDSESNTFYCTLPVSRITINDGFISMTTQYYIEWLRYAKRESQRYNYVFEIVNRNTSPHTKHEPYFALYLKVNDSIFEVYREEKTKIRIKKSSPMNHERRLFIIANDNLAPLEPVELRGSQNLFVYGSALSNSFVIRNSEKVYDLSMFREMQNGGKKTSTTTKKQYIVYRSKKYVVRKTLRNAMYIVVSGKKKYLSSIKKYSPPT